MTTDMELLADFDFAKSADGFQLRDNGPIQTSWEDGTYRILCKNGGLWWPEQKAIHNLPLTDFVCEIDAQLARAPSGCAWGLGLTRLLPPRHPWTGILLDREGKVGARLYDEAAFLPWSSFAAVKPAPEFNTLRVEVRGNNIRLFCNGQYLTDLVQERLLSPHGLNLYIQASETPAEVRFRRLRIWHPRAL